MPARRASRRSISILPSALNAATAPARLRYSGPRRRLWLVDDNRQMTIDNGAGAPASRRMSSSIRPGTEVTLDGNSVDLDHEKTTAAENAVDYEAAATFTTQTISMLMTAITGSRVAAIERGLTHVALRHVLRIAGSGMSAQSERLSAVASNLANANTAVGPGGQPYRAREVVFQAQSLDGDDGDAGVGRHGRRQGRRRLSKAMRRCSRSTTRAAALPTPRATCRCPTSIRSTRWST